jgi:hypothetical protein
VNVDEFFCLVYFYEVSVVVVVHNLENVNENYRYYDKQHLDPSTAATGRNSQNKRRQKLETMMFRNDSLSSDPSDCARPPPPKPHKNRIASLFNAYMMPGKTWRRHTLFIYITVFSPITRSRGASVFSNTRKSVA